MTSQILASELTTLIQDSKRKNPELKSAAETSLSDLKSLPTTSEKQISSDLARRPQFINPFLIACSSKNPKFAAIGMSSLQRLAAAQALPRTRLKDVLDAITECTTLGFEIQLKILQTLPSLLQNYAEHINGAAFFTVIQICSTLQASKTASVSSTSAATLQQLFTSLYEKLALEDKKSLEVPTIADVKLGEVNVRVRTVAQDAFRVLNDLCLLIGGSKPQYVKFSPTSEPALLELFESIFTGHSTVINNHPEQAYLIRTLLIPYLIKSFSERSVFPITVRITRILYLILKNHLTIFEDDTETILQWLNHSLESEGSVSWKRILCMEVYREIFTEPVLILQIHSKYKKQKDQKAIIPDCLAQFVRLATEKPALLGVGQQSSIPIGNYFQRESAGEQPDAAALTAGSAGVPTSAVPGISVQFSSIRTPLIEQLDKSEPPSSPETYIYSLVLASLNNLAESLAKYILPLTVGSGEKVKSRVKLTTEDSQTVSDDPSDAQSGRLQLRRNRSMKKKAALVNPLDLETHPAYENVKAAADLLDMAWHAILATYSTFFHSALDSENYRALVRAFQKYTQVTGLLHMSVPRDAFLTTLGKNAMPPNLVTAGAPNTAPTQPPTPSTLLSNAKGFLNVENIVNQASSFLPERRRQSLDNGEPVLSVRNLLCLRALLNLAIALGPTLQKSWSIVFETLQQADRVFANSGTRPFRSSSSGSQTPVSTSGESSASQQIGSEITAVQSAASRLFESTAEFSDEAFVYVLQSLCALVHKEAPKQSAPSSTNPSDTPGHKRRIASFSGLSVKTGLQEHDFLFTLTKLRELATLNLERFVVSNDDSKSGWNVMIEQLISTATDSRVPPTARLLAVDLVRKVVLDSMIYPIDTDQVEPTLPQTRALAPLKTISQIFQQKGTSTVPDETAVEAHSIILETLRSLLEHIGESLEGGWPQVFELINSGFRLPLENSSEVQSEPKLISMPLGRSAFSSIQLVCSDFLSSKLDVSLPALIDILYNFNSQKQDLNIALTTTTFFWNVSDFVYGKMPQNALNKYAAKTGEITLKPIPISSQKSKDSDFMPEAWLYLLRKLTDLIADSRHEVRNSTIHTTMRIFDNNGDDLSPKTWQLCLQSILLAMVSTDVKTYKLFQEQDGWKSSPEDIEAVKAKTSTTQVLLEALSKLITTYLDDILQTPQFSQLWDSFIDSLARYLSYELHDLTAAVFASLNVILAKGSDTKFPPEATAKAAELWHQSRPSSTSQLPSTSNIAAFESYTGALLSIYKLHQSTITKEDTEKIVQNLEACLRGSESPSYSNDMDSLTNLQSRIIQCLSMLRTDIEGTTGIIIDALTRFMALPFEIAESGQKSGLTCIALSKASMGVIEGLIIKNMAWEEVFVTDSLHAVLSNLERTITLKTKWQRQGRNPPLWQRATTSSLILIEHLIPKMAELDIDQAITRKYWDIIVQIAHNIAHAADLNTEATPLSAILENESFDITSLQKLQSFLIPALGSSTLPDSTRRTYTRSLFTASLIHYTDPISYLQLDTAPLSNLYTIRRGRTLDPPPCIRRSMAYFCFRSLLSLLRLQDSSPSQLRLAKAAAPYVILRAALLLRGYIADQPLRGRLPLKQSLRVELVTVLSELAKLRCEPQAIPPTKEGGVSGQGAHLVRLFPLVVKAAGIKNGPGDVKAELGRWMEKLGVELGLDEV